MTTKANLSPAPCAAFDLEVHRISRSKQFLTASARTRTGVVGSTVNFPKVGKGQASVRTPATDVVPLNKHVLICSLYTSSDYYAVSTTDIFLQQKVNFDERRELAQVVGSAIGRRQDQILLDALSDKIFPRQLLPTLL